MPAPHLASTLLLAAGLAFAQTAPEEPPLVTFHSQTRLVLVPFRVSRGKNYVRDLRLSDVTLLDDGKPREFTIFDSPATQGRMPLELVLLFDTNPAIEYFWDPVEVFRFVPQWNEAMTQAILEKDIADVRISVYRCAGQRLFRVSRATTDARQITSAFQRILRPELLTPATGTQAITLSLPGRRDQVGRGPFTNDYPTSYFVSAEQRGWPMEAAIGVLNDVASAQDKVSRVMVMFSEGIGATTTIPEDVGNEALDLGIPLYPVATDYKNHLHPGVYPRNLFRMRQFEALGKMTGGRSVEYTQVDAATLSKILESVRDDGLAQYVVGFVPSSAGGTSKEHRLEVRLKSKSSGTLEGGKRRAIY